MGGRGGGRGPAVGLDIGSTAVRGVQLGGSSGRSVIACGQVGLHPGTVVEGEVRDSAALAAALRRLWAEAGFTTTKVVVAVSGQRVIVREADVSAMSAEDFRTAMNFEVQDLIPIATADAALDFQILGEATPASNGRDRMRILLAGADRTAVARVLDVLGAAGLDPVAVDVVPSALMRAGRLAQEEGVGLVSIGGSLTNVLLATPDAFFSRTLAVGAGEMTKGIGVRLGVEATEAEAVKRYAGSDQRGAGRAAALVADESSALIEQIVESFEFFHSQGRTGPLQTVRVTGGGSLTAGLTGTLAALTGATIEVVDPFDGLDAGGLALEAADLARFRSVGAVAAGLAAWPHTSDAARFNLLPSSILEARARRKAIVVGVAGLAVAVTALAGVGVARHQQVNQVRAEVAAANAQNVELQRATAALGQVTAYDSAVKSRQSSLTAAATGVDWPALVQEITSAVPNGQFTLTSIALAAAPPAATASTPSPTTAAPAATVTMQVTAQGGTAAVATWMRLMATIPALSNVVVPGDSVSQTGATFTCTASLTKKAPTTTYAWEAKK
ncbi:MAG TPA: type IV pilus assembly protein PilM [Acidimicrobiales bacterium]|nr:type IV pilus assembly protein PilM [Acidimicrobiales bacterium]